MGPELLMVSHIILPATLSANSGFCWCSLRLPQLHWKLFVFRLEDLFTMRGRATTRSSLSWSQLEEIMCIIHITSTHNSETWNMQKTWPSTVKPWPAKTSKLAVVSALKVIVDCVLFLFGYAPAVKKTAVCGLILAPPSNMYIHQKWWSQRNVKTWNKYVCFQALCQCVALPHRYTCSGTE